MTSYTTYVQAGGLVHDVVAQVSWSVDHNSSQRRWDVTLGCKAVIVLLEEEFPPACEGPVTCFLCGLSSGR